MPPNEQALRALEQPRGAAALEFEDVNDDIFDVDNGKYVFLQALGKQFVEKELYRRGGVIREYETLARAQGKASLSTH